MVEQRRTINLKWLRMHLLMVVEHAVEGTIHTVVDEVHRMGHGILYWKLKIYCLLMFADNICDTYIIILPCTNIKERKIF